MRIATLAAVLVGLVVLLLDLGLLPSPHDRDPFWWLSAALVVSGLAAGAYVRRHDARLRRSTVDGRGVEAGLRAQLGLPEDRD